MVPIIIYLVSFILSAAGPGAISVQTVMVLFAVPLGIHMGINPVLMGAMAILGAVGGTASPIALTGIIVGDLLNEMEITGQGMPIFIGVSVANFICAIVTYILFKGWKNSSQKVHKLLATVWFRLDYKERMKLSQSFAVPSPSNTFCCILRRFCDTALLPIAIKSAMLEGETSILMSIQMRYSVSERG